MPELSRFYGITVRMWYDDHPPPHIHVEYGEYRAKIYLTGEVDGYMPKRALNLIWVWMEEHEEELEAKLGTRSESSAVTHDRTVEVRKCLFN
jgi:hypothetical protein